MDLNELKIIGNLGNEPEMRFSANGKPVTNFPVATNRRFITADGERREDTQWFTIVTWGKLAESCNQYLVKGSLVYVSGRVTLHQWESQDGQKRSRMEIIAGRVIFLSKSDKAKKSEAEPEYLEDLELDDIPF